MIFDRPVIYGTSYKGKLYVGKHIGSGKDYVGSGLIISNIIKSGKEKDLITGVIEYVDDKEKLNEREIYWIKKLKPKLNLTQGGDGWAYGDKNPSRRPEVRKIVREKLLGSKRPDVLGDKNPSCRPEVRLKLSKALKGRRTWDNRGDNHPMKRPEIAKKVSEKTKGVKKTFPIGYIHHTKTLEYRKKMSMMRKGIPMPQNRGINNPNCKDPSKLYILFINNRNRYMVRVPSHKTKSFKNIKEAMIYRDKIVSVN